MIGKVLKNRSNEIRSNEIRIRQELPVIHCGLYNLLVIWELILVPDPTTVE